MNAKRSWMVSIGIHGALLLWVAVMAVDHFVFEEGDGDGAGSGFSCRVGGPTAMFDRIERSKDDFKRRIPAAEESSGSGAYGPVGTFEGGMNQWSECCECACGGAATTLVAWPRDIVSYFDRRTSMATSRAGVPRLSTHSRRCPFRDTGLESDCTCGLIPPRN
jgi:hypothetical protein